GGGEEGRGGCGSGWSGEACGRIAKPTPGVPDVMVPSRPPESASRSAVRCSTTSLSQNQCGPGCSGSVITVPTLSPAAGTAAASATRAAAARSRQRDAHRDRGRSESTTAPYSTHGRLQTTPDVDVAAAHAYDDTMRWETWSVFTVTEAILCLTPGPAVLFVLAQGLGRGTGASFWASCGILAGN